jgi:hypothetical protein
LKITKIITFWLKKLGFFLQPNCFRAFFRLKKETNIQHVVWKTFHYNKFIRNKKVHLLKSINFLHI